VKNEDIEYRYSIEDNEKENIDALNVILPQTILWLLSIPFVIDLAN